VFRRKKREERVQERLCLREKSKKTEDGGSMTEFEGCLASDAPNTKH